MSWKYVWAAAFTQEYFRNSKLLPWDLDQAADAAERAWATVAQLKAAIPRIEERYEEGSEEGSEGESGILELAKQFVIPDFETDR